MSRTSQQRPLAELARAARVAAVLVVLILVGIAVLAWISAGNDTLPFQYGGFD